MKVRKMLLVLAALVMAMVMSQGAAMAADKVTEIKTVDDWNAFVESVAAGENYKETTVTLMNDISVGDAMVGDDPNELMFMGTFDGNGKTITVDIDTDEAYAAPFRSIWDATIKNLHVAGNIKTSAKYAAGIAAHTYRHSTIENSRSSVSIESTVEGDGTNGGIVAVNGRDNMDSIITIKGCIFDGELLGSETTNNGGLVGWSTGAWDYSADVQDSVFAPKTLTMSDFNSSTFVRYDENSGFARRNAFYTKRLGAEQGAALSDANKLILPEDTEIEGVVEYSVSGLKTCGEYGMQYDGNIYVQPNAKITLKYTGELRDDEGFIYSINGEELPVGETTFEMPNTNDPVEVTVEVVKAHDVKTSGITGGSLEISPKRAKVGQEITIKLHPSNGYSIEGMILEYEHGDEGEVDQIEPAETVTITMPNSDVIIYAKFKEVPFITEINTAEDWSAFAKSLESGGAYTKKKVTLNADIKVTEMVGSEKRPFDGIFDGNGHTLTLDISGGEGEDYVAPFRHLKSAEIKNLIVDGTINTSGMYAGGIAGESMSGYYESDGTRITNCRSSVTINSTKDGDGTHGGIIGRNSVHGQRNYMAITGCVFDGKLLSEGGKTTHSAGFVGFDHLVCYAIDSFFIPSEITYGTSHAGTFMRVAINDYPSLKNSYYTEPFGAAHGFHAQEIKLAEGIILPTASKTYDVSGLSFLQGAGLKYKGKYYATKDNEIQIRYEGDVLDDDAVIFVINKLTSGTTEEIRATDRQASFKMPDEPIEITARTEHLYKVNIGVMPLGTLETDVKEALVGDTVTVTAKPERGYTAVGQKLSFRAGGHLEDIEPDDDGKYRFQMPAYDVSLKINFDAVPFISAINSDEDWEDFVASVNAGGDYSGKTVKLNSDITVSKMAGTEEFPFNGGFDGNGHTITCNISDTDGQGQAPFRYVESAELKNINVTGNVSGGTHAAGLVGFTWSGNNTIENCIVLTNVTTNGSHAGGIVGHSKTAGLTIKGSLFGGKISGYTSFAGGFVGWTDGSAITVKDSLSGGFHDGSGKYHAIVLKNADSSAACSLENSYYDGTGAIEVDSGAKQFVTAGVQARVVTLGDEVDLAGGHTEYSVSGIEAIGSSALVLKMGPFSSMFSGKDKELDLVYEGALSDGEKPIFKVNDAELKPGESKYVMKDEETNVTVRKAKVYKVEVGTVKGGTVTPDYELQEKDGRVELALQAEQGWTTEDMKITIKYTEGGEEKTKDVGLDVSGKYSFTMPEADVTVEAEFVELVSLREIASEEDWIKLASALEKGADYSGITVKLLSDITVDTMVGTLEHPFTGAFDGDGHTITVDIDSDEEYVAPFRVTKNAAINNLKVTGTIHTTRKFAGGFVGWAKGGISIKNSQADVKIVSRVSGDGTHGGFIARQGEDTDRGTIMIEGSIVTGCIVMDQSAPGVTTNCGGFVGFGYAPLAEFTNCAYASTGDDGSISEGCATYIRQDSSSRMYVSGLFACTESFGSRQNAGLSYRLNAGKNVEIVLPESEYSLTGITDGSFVKDGQLYYMNGREVEARYTGEPAEGETILFMVNGELILENTFVMPSQDTVVTARAAKKCTVSFDANGGSGEMESDDAAVDMEYVLPYCSFKAPSEKQRFVGWQIGDDPENIKRAEEKIRLTGDTTLKAVWQEYLTEVDYIDANGEEKTVNAINIATCDESENYVVLGEEGETTWYYADRDYITDKGLDLYGTVNLILKDDVKIQAKRMWLDGNTAVYGQKAGSGKLILNEITSGQKNEISFCGGDVSVNMIDGDETSIKMMAGKLSVNNPEKFDGAVYCESLTVYGGELNVESNAFGYEGILLNGTGIIAEKLVDIKAGTVNVHVSLSDEEAEKDYQYQVRMYAISANEIRITGGNVTAVVDEYKGSSDVIETYGLNSDTKIELGWTELSDSIKATSYIADKGNGDINVDPERPFVDGEKRYSGKLSEEDIAKAAGKLLTPPGFIKSIDAKVPAPICGTEIAAGYTPAVELGVEGAAVVSGSSKWSGDAEGAEPFTGKIEGGKDYYICFTISIDELHMAGKDEDMFKVNGVKAVKVTQDPETGDFTIVAKVTADHDWDSGVITKEPTTTAEGEKTYTCKCCGEKKTEVEPKKDPAPTPGKDDGKGEDGTAVGKGADANKAAAAIMKSGSDEGPAGTKFAPLKVKSTKQTKKSIKLAWTKAKGAVKYVIFGNQCGKKNKMKKIATVKGKTYNVKKAGKKLKKGKPYKFIVMAVDKNNKVVSTSKTVHAFTKGKYTNPKSIKVTKKVLAKAKKLKKGKKLSLKAKIVKKGKVKLHRKLMYESTNLKIAKVTKKGVVKALKKGTCYVYAYGPNGVNKKIKVVVK